MKKSVLIVMAMLLFIGISENAFAIYFSKAYYKDVWFDENNTSYQWTFDLDNSVSGIDKEDTINWAIFKMGFWDADCDYQEEETGEVATDDGASWSGEIDTGILWACVTGSLSDHVLKVTVNRLSGDFLVTFTKVFGDYTDNSSDENSDPASVPEPATILLLGVSLAGLAWKSRKKA